MTGGLILRVRRPRLSVARTRTAEAMRMSRTLRTLALLAVVSLAVTRTAAAQHGGPRDGLSIALGAGSLAASGESRTRPLGSVALRFVLPSSPLVLRADAAASSAADDPSLATAALGIRLLQVEGSSLYLLGGVGAYAGRHAKRSGRNVGGGVELRPALLRGRAAFLEGRAHAWFRSDLQGRHTERLTTIVAGLWW